MTACVGCGDCCERIWLSAQSMQQVERIRNGERAPVEEIQADLSFIAEHWVVVEDRDDGGARLACDQFDATTRRCTAHDDRPPVCRGYPWYGKPPSQVHAERLSPRCSFVADVIVLGPTR